MCGVSWMFSNTEFSPDVSFTEENTVDNQSCKIRSMILLNRSKYLREQSLLRTVLNHTSCIYCAWPLAIRWNLLRTNFAFAKRSWERLPCTDFCSTSCTRFHFQLLRSERENGICAMPVSRELRHFLMRNDWNSLLRTEFGNWRLHTSVSTLPSRSCRVVTYAAWATHVLTCLHRFCKNCIEPRILIGCLHSIRKVYINVGVCDTECLHKFCEKLFAYVLQRLHSVFGFAQCLILLNLYALGHGVSRRVRSGLTFEGQ